MREQHLWGLLLVGGIAVTACGGSVVSGDSGAGGGGGGAKASSSSSSPTGSATSGTASSSGAGSGSSSGVGTGSGSGSASGSSSGGFPAGSAVTFAIRKLYLGDTDWNGAPDKANGWKQYGLNLDGKVSTVNSLDLCKPAAGSSPKTVYPDGDNGIDNSWGKNVLGIELGIASDIGSKLNDALLQGGATTLVQLVNLSSGANQTPVGARILLAAPLGQVPKYDGSDVWPVDAASLSDPGNIQSATSFFPAGILANDHWSSVSSASVLFPMPVAITPSPVLIRHARIELDLTSAHDGIVHGVIGGVLVTQEFITLLKHVAGSFDASLCSGPTIDSIVAQIKQASDIMADGSQDPGKTCDGISVGLGFEAAIGKVGGVVNEPSPPNPCGP